MESNWRQGVYYAGWQGGPWKFVARYTPGLFPGNRLAYRRQNDIGLYAVGTADMQGWVETWTNVWADNASFPSVFWANVESDNP